MLYNPYDLLSITINGKPAYARPYELDSAITNDVKMTNAFDELVKPSKATTTCPDCGQGLELELEGLDQPPFTNLEVICTYCGEEVVFDPFVNPLTRISIFSPILTRPDQNLITSKDNIDDIEVGVVEDKIKTVPEPINNQQRHEIKTDNIQTQTIDVEEDMAGADLEDLYD